MLKIVRSIYFTFQGTINTNEKYSDNYIAQSENIDES